MSFGTKLTSSMLALMLVTGFGAGCAPKAAAPTPAPENVAALAPPAPPRAADEYRIQAGDELHVRFTYQPEMNEQIPVRPDGRISLATTGEITATGLTPSELERLVARKSEHRLKNPEVVVVVTKIAEQRVYVGGEVLKPGYVTLQAGMTPLQAVVQTGAPVTRSPTVARARGPLAPSHGRAALRETARPVGRAADR